MRCSREAPTAAEVLHVGEAFGAQQEWLLRLSGAGIRLPGRRQSGVTEPLSYFAN